MLHNLRRSTRYSQSLAPKRKESFAALIPTIFLAFFFMVVSVSSSFAQAVFGSIVGTVTDPTGAVVPNATVVVTDVSKGTSQTV